MKDVKMDEFDDFTPLFIIVFLKKIKTVNDKLFKLAVTTGW